MTIAEFMTSPGKQELMQELASTGASIAAIEAKLGMRQGQLSLWLEKGKAKPRTIYHRFWKMYRSWVADATIIAQQAMLTKRPDKWLETNSSARTVETPQQSNALISGGATANGNITINNPIIIAALNALREAGINPAEQPTIEGQVIQDATNENNG